MRKFNQKSASTEHINKQLNDERELKWLPLAPPDYIIDPSLLLDSFVERECYFIGVLSNVPTDLDLKKRAQLLHIIDGGHSSKKLASPSVSCILSISAQNIKFNRRIFPETIISRILMENIISVAYIRDNSLHYIVILHLVSPDMNSSDGNLTIIATNTHIKAEEICSLVSQCFQILYTEATLRHFDRQLYSTISHSADDYSRDVMMELQNRKLIEHQSRSDHETDRTFNEIESVYSELSASKVDFLQNYMARLQQVLTPDEMKQYATELAAWQKGSPFESFCRKAKQLLGAQRLSLLADMRFFIDPADKFTLEQFINDFNSPSKSRSPHGHWSQLLAKSPLPIQMQRSLSYASTSNGVLSIYDEENSLRDDFSSPIKNSFTANSVGNVNDNEEFAKHIDTLFQKVGDLDRILASDNR